MDWKEASAYYEARLSDALYVQRHALDLAKIPQAEVPSNLKDVLIEEAEPIKKQLERLKKREFRIAVVGLEKAGKSTFLNAWLGCDLLPSKATRCTFTTTQIYSVSDESDQRLEIQTKSDSEFQRLIKELEERGETEDLNTIRQNKSTLDQVRRDGNQTIPFILLDEVKEHLRKYVADERFAHAVLEARLYTSRLAQAEGIVFYDVPGSDSGLAKHVDEAKQMLSDCDAVILVQRDPSLKGKQLEIIEFTDVGDKNVSVADKLFVFLSRIDSQATREGVEQIVEAAYEDWRKRAALSRKRVVAGSAGAHLVLNGYAEDQTRRDIGSVEDVRLKLEKLTGIKELEQLKKSGTGIPEIKSRIFHYIDNERVEILKKRCETSISAILDTATKIYDSTRKKYPEDPEEARRVEEESQVVGFSEWWSEKWKEISSDIERYYKSCTSAQKTDLSAEEPNSIEKFNARYLQVVESQMKQLRESAFSKKARVFEATSDPYFDRDKANRVWREEFYSDVRAILLVIASQLAVELQDESMKLVEYMTSLLWGSELVKTRLIDDSKIDFIDKLENSLGVLFLRFSRPVAEVLIKAPVDSDTRKSTIKSLGADAEIVDNYYSGEEPAFRVLKKYAKYGAKLLFDEALRQKQLGVTGVATHLAEMAAQKVSEAVENGQKPEEEVIFEVENDLRAFEEYLRAGIFEAAGFDSYCQQELRGLVDNFKDKEGTWMGAATVEWQRENPDLLSELPINLRSQEFSLEVSERLKELAVALQKTNTHLST